MIVWKHIFMSFLQFFLKLVLELHTQRGVLGVLRSVKGAFGCTFAFFLMGIVPNNHQNNCNNETIIIDCVGSGSAVTLLSPNEVAIGTKRTDFATTADMESTLTQRIAETAVEGINSWRLPTQAELNRMYSNMNAINAA